MPWLAAQTILKVSKCKFGIIFKFIWGRGGESDDDPENKASKP